MKRVLNLVSHKALADPGEGPRGAHPPPPLFLDQLSPLFSTQKAKFSDSKLGWLPFKMALEPSQLFVSHVNGLRVL